MTWSDNVAAKLSGKNVEPADQLALPLKTRSLCPECLRVIDAVIAEQDQKVYMDKTCPEHGPYRELISTDVTFYKLMLQRDRAHPDGVTNPLPAQQASCPNACGICGDHLSPTVMINIDLTNRCNLNCPICFANADARQCVVEWSLDQVRQMLDTACATHEVQPACLQYTGGEPTVHPQFIEALQEANKRDFAQIQIATNGIKFAYDPQLAFQASQAGLNIVYMQFDGLDDEVYKQTRGRPLVDIKLKAIDNLYQAGVRTILVPTIVKGVNDQQIGKIFRFAVDNIDKISGISWQPVAFTGRIDYEQRLAQRFTLSDLVREIQQQTGAVDMYRDWYPFSFVDPFSRLLEAIRGTPQVQMSCSPLCGVATYVFIGPHQGKLFPLPSFVDVEPLINRLATSAERVKKRHVLRKLTMAHELRALSKFYHQDRAPQGWDFETFMDFMLDFVDFGQRYRDNQARRAIISEKSYRVLLLASMHFQDAYNYQLDRLQRCVIHYAAPDGRIYPFCSYNSGPCHRNRVEREFAISLAEYKDQVRQEQRSSREVTA